MAPVLSGTTIRELDRGARFTVWGAKWPRGTTDLFCGLRGEVSQILA
ncbi:MAG: hypothetical protein ACR2QA_09975 [Solirubrobacteraceae bacterium]